MPQPGSEEEARRFLESGPSVVVAWCRICFRLVLVTDPAELGQCPNDRHDLAPAAPRALYCRV